MQKKVHDDYTPTFFFFGKPEIVECWDFSTLAKIFVRSFETWIFYSAWKDFGASLFE